MSDKPSSNVKIYDRPEKKGPSPLMLIIGLLLVLIVGFILYKAFYHPAATGNTPTGMVPVFSAQSQVSTTLWQNKGLA